ncbi:MAG TPA: hypothetical protein VGF43_02360 [Dongiaceae bacterium]
MRRASSLFGLAVLILGLTGPGADTAYAQDSTRQLTSEAPAQQQSGAPVAVLQSWSFAGEDSKPGATATPFVVDLPPESQTVPLESESIYEPPAEQSNEPHNFRINDRLKVKAQPMGGGLGGRVTLTFSFDTGY